MISICTYTLGKYISEDRYFIHPCFWQNSSITRFPIHLYWVFLLFVRQCVLMYLWSMLDALIAKLRGVSSRWPLCQGAFKVKDKKKSKRKGAGILGKCLSRIIWPNYCLLFFPKILEAYNWCVHISWFSPAVLIYAYCLDVIIKTFPIYSQKVSGKIWNNISILFIKDLLLWWEICETEPLKRGNVRTQESLQAQLF